MGDEAGLGAESREGCLVPSSCEWHIDVSMYCLSALRSEPQAPPPLCHLLQYWMSILGYSFSALIWGEAGWANQGSGDASAGHECECGCK